MGLALAGQRWQEQAPSGHKTQAQLDCPPTCTRWAQTSLWLDGRSCECGRGGRSGREEGKGALLGPCNPMPVLRSDLGPWIPGSGPRSHFWPRALTSAWAVEDRRPSVRGEGLGRGEGQGEKPTAAYMGARGGRQTEGPHPEEKCVVAYLLKLPRGSSRAGPTAPQPQVLGVLPWGPGRTEAQGGRQMGQREMRSQGHPKATDSNTPGEGGTSCPLQEHHLEKVPLLSHPRAPSSNSRHQLASRGCCRS